MTGASLQVGDRVYLPAPHEQRGVVTRVVAGPEPELTAYYVQIDGQQYESGPYADAEADDAGG